MLLLRNHTSLKIVRLKVQLIPVLFRLVHLLLLRSSLGEKIIEEGYADQGDEIGLLYKNTSNIPLSQILKCDM